MNALLWLALLPLQTAPLAPSADALARPFELTFEEIEGELWCSLDARRVPLDQLVDDLAARMGLYVEGLHGGETSPLVTVELKKRPVNQVLAVVLGSVGLRADTRVGALVVRPNIRDPQDAEELRDLAMAAYLRATRAFPDHAQAAEAERSQATIEERRGDLEAARNHYETLIEAHPSSPLAPLAYLRSAEILERAGRWADAAERLTALLGLVETHDFDLPARVELARALAHVGESKRALYMLDALDTRFAPSTPEERQDRLYIRARALAGTDRDAEALAALDEADSFGLDAERRRTSLELRATALERSAPPAAAARAWLAYASDLPESERAAALERAAQLALRGGDELGALFVCEVGAKGAESQRFARLAQEARTQLGIDAPRTPAASVDQRLARGERLVAAGLHSEARAVLEGLLATRGALDEDERTRLVIAYARSIAGAGEVDAAAAFVRDSLPQIARPDHRRALYLYAAELFEEQGRVDAAIDAYQGRL